MSDSTNALITNIPSDPKQATQRLIDLLTVDLKPRITTTKTQLASLTGKTNTDDPKLKQIKSKFELCCNQILKSAVTFCEIFKEESKSNMLMQESRDYVTKQTNHSNECLLSLEKQLQEAINMGTFDIIFTEAKVQLNFLHWMDATFDIIDQLSNLLIDDQSLSSDSIGGDKIRVNVSHNIISLHGAIDELLLAAMTICKYCLHADQYVITARCKVVLRETKTLLVELYNGDAQNLLDISNNFIKGDIHISSVNVIMSILKDSLYALEVCINNALLTLLASCFAKSINPIDALNKHYSTGRIDCDCSEKDALKAQNVNEPENCLILNEFDSFCDRLKQIAMFAISCSTDEQRILALESSLATLEALDPYVVSSVMMSNNRPHTNFLIQNWKNEVNDVKTNIYLIVDPAAFIQSIKNMMFSKFKDIREDSPSMRSAISDIIEMGELALDFVEIYETLERDALPNFDEINLLLKNFKKAIKECDVVNRRYNCLSTDRNLTKTKRGPITFERLLKRMKMLYTLTNRLWQKLKIDTDNYKSFEDESSIVESETYTNKIDLKQQSNFTYQKNNLTKVNSIMRSTFIRKSNTQERRNNPDSIVIKLNDKLQFKYNEIKNTGGEFNFSAQIESLFSSFSAVEKGVVIDKKHSNVSTSNRNKLKDLNRNSLRRELLKKSIYSENNLSLRLSDENVFINKTYTNESLYQSTSSHSSLDLQVTEILDNLKTILSLKSPNHTSKRPVDQQTSRSNGAPLHKLTLMTNTGNSHGSIDPIGDLNSDNIIRIEIRNSDSNFDQILTETQNYRNDNSVNEKKENTTFHSNASSNYNDVLHSDIDTPERLHDLKKLERKLAVLKNSRIETNL